MARPLRVNLPGGWHHVTARRWKGEKMFYDNPDHLHFLQLLEELVRRYGIEVHAYALMVNHYHLLTRSPKGNLSRAMQWLNVSYGMWHNRRWKESGPLLQGRYKAVPVEGEGAWALEVSRYIHLNPVRVTSFGLGKKHRKAQKAGFEDGPTDEQRIRQVEHLREYRWSSYRAYAGYEPAPSWLTCDVLWERNGKGHKAEEYRRWLEEDTILQGTEEAWAEKVKTALAIGSEQFRMQLRKKVKGNAREQPESRLWKRMLGFEAIKQAVEAEKGESWEAFRDRRGDWGRDVALCLARRHTGMTLPEIAQAAGVTDHRAVGKAIERFEKRIQQEESLAKIVRRLEKEMSTGLEPYFRNTGNR